jgi:hypothetical protein
MRAPSPDSIWNESSASARATPELVITRKATSAAVLTGARERVSGIGTIRIRSDATGAGPSVGSSGAAPAASGLRLTTTIIAKTAVTPNTNPSRIAIRFSPPPDGAAGPSNSTSGTAFGSKSNEPGMSSSFGSP